MYKDGFVFEVWDKNIRLVIKTKGFVCFWMIEHDCCLRQKDLYANRFKGEKLQANRVSFDQEEK